MWDLIKTFVHAQHQRFENSVTDAWCFNVIQSRNSYAVLLSYAPSTNTLSSAFLFSAHLEGWISVLFTYCIKWVYDRMHRCFSPAIFCRRIVASLPKIPNSDNEHTSGTSKHKMQLFVGVAALVVYILLVMFGSEVVVLSINGVITAVCTWWTTQRLQMYKLSRPLLHNYDIFMELVHYGHLAGDGTASDVSPSIGRVVMDGFERVSSHQRMNVTIVQLTPRNTLCIA